MLVAGDGLGFTALFVFTGRKSSSEVVSPVMGSFPVSCAGGWDISTRANLQGRPGTCKCGCVQ